MKYSKLALGFILLLVSFYGQSQNLQFQWEPCTNCTANYPTYNAAVAMTSFHVTEDYGRRDGNYTSLWHNGMDINGDFAGGDRGYHIKSITAGTVAKIYMAGTYKVLVIDGPGNQNFAYGHIFLDSETYPYRVGDMVLTRFTANGMTYGAIIYDPSNAQNAYCLTDAPLNGSASDASYVTTYTRPDGTIITFSTANGNLRNEVAQGDIIAPIGGSGGFGGGNGKSPADHVHLYNFVGTLNNIGDFQVANNLRNPLNLLEHIQRDLTNTIQEIRINDNITPVVGTSPVYGMLDIKARVSFPTQQGTNGGQATTRYSATSPIFNLNKVELWLKPNDLLQPATLLKGQHFEAKIDYGGRWTAPGNIRYPSFDNPSGNTVGGDLSGHNSGAGVDIAQVKTASATKAGFGDYRKTGIYSNAYTTYLNADSYDEFYFNDYHTRIHQNDNFGKASPLLAMRSEDARYPDGPYQLNVKSQTVRDVSRDMQVPRDLVFDNFKPFLRSVKVFTDVLIPPLTDPGYHREWVWNSASESQTLGPDQALQDMYQGEAIRIEVMASESLQQLSITIPTLGVTNQAMQVAVGNKLWYYTIPGSAVTTGNHAITFIGADYAGNALVAVPGRIPYRADDGTWVNPPTGAGQDQNHQFFIEPGSCPGDGGRIAGACDIIADYTYAVSSSDPLSVSFADSSFPTGSATSWSWNFGDPTSSSNTSTAKNPSHRFAASGTYTVTLTVGDGVTSDVHSKQIIVDNTTVSVSFSASSTVGNVPLAVQLSGVVNVSNVTSWEWLVTPATGYSFSPNATSQNTSVTFATTGSYSIRLRIVRNGTVYTSLAQTVQVNSATNPIPQFTWDQAYAYSTIKFRDNSFLSGSCTPGTSEWTFTNPFGGQEIQSTTTGGPLTYYPIYVGTYQVQLCVTDKCNNRVCTTKSINVQLKQNTIAPDFTASSINITRGESIQYRDITSDPENKIQHWGWWLDHVPGTSWGACQRCYMRGEDSYSGVETKQYTVPGTYEVRLMVHEDIGYAGLSKTITVDVKDNIITEMANNAITNPVSGAAVSGNYVAYILNPRTIYLYKRNGNSWNRLATLTWPNDGGTNPWVGVTFEDNTLVVRNEKAIYIWQKPASGDWVNATPTQSITSATAGAFVVALKGNRMVVLSESVRDGNHTFLHVYEKTSTLWPTTPTAQINVGYGVKSTIGAVLDDVSIVVSQSNSDDLYKDRLAIYEKSGATWVLQATLTKNTYYFAAGLGISNGVIVATNPSVYHTGATPRESYVYVRPAGGWQTNAEPTATLTLETPEPVAAEANSARIDGDNIVTKVGRQIVLYHKPYNGWHDMKETVRLKKVTPLTTDWPTVYMDLDKNYVTVSTFLDNQLGNYIFEIEPTFCDDPQTLASFNIANGESISNQKGVLTIGGGGSAIIQGGGVGKFRGTQITLKPGFQAKPYSNVTITGTTCEDF